MTLFIGEDLNLLRWIFLVGEISKFLAVGWDSLQSHTQGSHKVLGEEAEVHTWWGQQSNIKVGNIFGTKGYMRYILGYNPSGNCF